MPKKLFRFVSKGAAAILLFAFSCILLPLPAQAAEPPALNAASYVLMSADTGEILAEKNGNEQRFPASTTKLMTMTLIFEALRSGQISLEDSVTTSEYAAGMGGSQVYLEVGETRTLKEMLIGIAVGSGNDASVAVAEYFAGSEENFVEKMNQKAEELGMINTHYMNPHGLHDENHYTTARDMATLAYYVLRNYPEILEYTSIYEYQFRTEPKQLVLWNTNKLLKWYEGADGLKTGYTSNAGRNLVATASRNGMRLISVVMGVEAKNGHFQESGKLLDFGFSQYSYEKIYDQSQVICSVPVDKGEAERLDLMTAEPVGILSEKSDSAEINKEITIEPNITAPIASGQVLGQVELRRGDEVVRSVDLVAITDVPRVSLSQCFLRTVREMTVMN